ncbi:MAG: Gfo/Idh/MocA family oxidoreductase [Verrucomicrobiota bacterium]
MKFGIIGTGMIGGFHAQAVSAMKGSELVGVVSKDLARSTVFAKAHGTTAYPSLEALASSTGLDIVTIATPSGVHLEPALEATRLGKHVIIEKPLEITTSRIDQIISSASENHVTVSAILNRRFHPGMDAFKQAADSGRFGTLTSASAYVKWYRDQAYYDSADWRGTWALDGGGALMNQSIHTIDALIYLAGPVKSVRAHTACLAHQNIEVEDIAVAMLEFENGARGVIEGSTCAWSQDGHPARVQLCGTEGSVFLADETFEVWDFRNKTDADALIHSQFMRGTEAGLGANDPTAINFYQHQRNFEEIVQAIREGRPASTNAAEARKSVHLIQAIYESARNNGAEVELS